MWAGRKQFASDIRSGGTEQPVCVSTTFQNVCVRARAMTRELLCESLSVCGTCVGVCVWVGGWVSSIPIHQSHQQAALCLRRKMNHAQRNSSRCCCSPCHRFLLIHTRVAESGPDTPCHHNDTLQHFPHRKLTHEDTCIPHMMIQSI